MSTALQAQPGDRGFSRRGFLNRLAISTAAALGGASGRAAGTAPPNIIFVLADDLGYGDLGCYGQKRFRTPNIDGLAEEGVRFTQFYAGAPVCSPSRCSLMTGLHTGHTRIRANFALAGGRVGLKGRNPARRANLTAADVTVGQLLQKAGYRTGLAGKWHLDGYDPTAGPMDHGFDEFSGWLTQTGSTSGYYPAQRYRNRELVDIPQNQAGARGLYGTDMCTEEACAFLRRNSSRPWFLYLAYDSPHSPLLAPSQGSYARESWPEPAKTYAAMIESMDNGVGRVMRTLKELGVDQNTIVFFSSDNGPRSEPTEELTAVAEFFDSNGPLRGYKRDLYEGGLRVPMIVRWPGRIRSSTTADAPGYFADFLPTAVALAGASPPACDGISLLPAFSGRRPREDRFLYWETFEPEFGQAVRWGGWKAVRRTLGSPLELYDLGTDIGERHDVAARETKVVKRIAEYLETARTDSPEFPIRKP